MADLETHLTFHAFRRGGASLLYANGVPIQDIKIHGTWASDAIDTYIRWLDPEDNPIAQCFRRL